MQQPQVEIFLAYSNRDRQLANELRQHLSILQGQKGQDPSVYIWSTDDVILGTDMEEAIEQHLDRAQIILMLVSPDFLSSEYTSNQLLLIEQKYKAETALALPIILRPTNLTGTFLANLKLLPANGKPLSKWTSRNLAYLEIIDAVKEAIETVQSPTQMDDEKKQLRKMLETFSDRELLILCLDLGLNIETLQKGISQRGLPKVSVDRLLSYMEQRSRIKDLADYVHKSRPHLKKKETA